MLDYRKINPKSGIAKELVILLHGYGSNKNDLITLAPDLAKFLPNACFISPNAPQEFDEHISEARQWFSLFDRSEASMLHGAQLASPILEEFILAILDQMELKEDRLALIGFSQGAMMALHAGLRMWRAPVAILCYSGMLIAPDLLREQIISRPDVMMIHGAEDHILPPICMDNAANALSLNHVRVECHLRPKLAHGIDFQGIQLGGNFLRNSFYKDGQK